VVEVVEVVGVVGVVKVVGVVEVVEVVEVVGECFLVGGVLKKMTFLWLRSFGANFR
jgi:hypothetical protein